MKLMIVSLLALFGLSFYIVKSNSNSKDSFGSIEDGKYIINIDTSGYKNKVEKALFPGNNLKFNTIRIIRQLTLGSKKEFFYVLLTTKDNQYNVAKWLSKKGNKLYTNDTIDVGDLFEQTYLICKGDGSCQPQVYEVGETRLWGCSEDVRCYINGKTEGNCSSYKSL